MIAGIRSLPEGVYRGEDVIEGDGIVTDDITIRVEITVRDGRFIADFSETDPQVLGPDQLPLAVGRGLRLLPAEVSRRPGAAGERRRLPPGRGPDEARARVLEAQFPAAVCNANIITTQRIVDAMLRALIEAAPERAIAACSGTMNLLNVGGYVPDSGRYFNYIETYGGGQGAMHDRDGMNGVHCAHDEHPQRAGRGDRGRVPAPRPLLWPRARHGGRRSLARRRRHAPRVRDPRARTRGSPSAATARTSIRGARSAASRRPVRPTSSGSTDGTRRDLPSKVTTFLQQGDHLRTVTPGGGGWGDPLERPAGPGRRGRSRGPRLARARRVGLRCGRPGRRHRR